MSLINRQLLAAVELGKLDRVRDLLNEHDLDKTEGHGYVLLRTAIILKHAEITKELISRGVRVNSKRSKVIPSNTPLHFAVQNGDIEIIEMLLDYDSDIDALNDKELTPLLCAITKDNEEIVDLLMRRGARVFNYSSISPIHITTKLGFYRMSKKLLELGSPVNSTCLSGEQFTPLHCAVHISGNLSIVELLLKHGANVDSKTAKGLTSMHFASERGNLEMIKLLLNNNADVNPRSKNNFTPLHFAVQNSHREAAKMLMDNGANIDAEFENGGTVLNLAVSRGLSFIVKDILKYFPDKNNTSNKNAIQIATKSPYDENLAITQSLMEYGFSVDPDNVNVLLQNAIKSAYIQIIQHLVGQGLHLACYKKENCNFLHIAARCNEIEIAKLLLDNGADVNATDEAGKRAIYYSTERSNVCMTKLLLSYGASLEKSPELLRVATRNNCKETVEILLQNKVDIEATDKYGRTALHLTALREYDSYIQIKEKFDIKTKGEIAKLLLSMGANVNAKTSKDGLTALHIACQKGLTSVVEVLLEYKADVNCLVKDCSPLMIAAQNREDLIIEMLLANGAAINSKRTNGDTALHIVARSSKKTALEILVRNGADVHSKNSLGATALHEAASQPYPEIVSILLQYGSTIDSQDKDGKTPLHRAVNSSSKEVVKLLLNSGSDINIVTNNNYTAIDIAHNLLHSAKITSDLDYYDSDNDCEMIDSYYDEMKYREVLEILEFHLIMLNTANLYVIDKNLMDTKRDYYMKMRTQKCEDEIKELKLEKIANNKISLYDILTKSIHSLARYSRNKDIIQVFKSDNYKTRFPIYAPIIESNLAKGTRRRLLLDQAQEFLKCHFELPYDCSEHILIFLSNVDLENVINVSKTPLTVKDL